MMLLWALLACGPAPGPEPVAPGPLPADSLYHLDVDLRDQDGRAHHLDVHRGHPTVISMFYASCPTACPMLIQDIQRLEDQLEASRRADLRVLLISLDPERDDPATLQDAALTHKVDGSRWTLSRAELDDVRLVAAALDVRYRALADGEMNHSSILTLVDADGVRLAKLEGLRQDPAPIIHALGGQ